MKGLDNIGIESQYIPINDIIADGRKISGNAQTRKQKTVLQHGTVLMNVDVDEMFSLLKVPNEKIKDKLIEDVKQRVTSIQHILKNDIEFDELADAASIFFKDELNYSEEALDWIKKEESISIFENMQDQIKKYSELTLDNFKELMKNVQNETGIKGKDLWMPVRAAITGQIAGPELPAVITVVGKKRVEAFLNQTIEIGKTK